MATQYTVQVNGGNSTDTPINVPPESSISPFMENPYLYPEPAFGEDDNYIVAPEERHGGICPMALVVWFIRMKRSCVTRDINWPVVGAVLFAFVVIAVVSYSLGANSSQRELIFPPHPVEHDFIEYRRTKRNILSVDNVYAVDFAAVAYYIPVAIGIIIIYVVYMAYKNKARGRPTPRVNIHLSESPV